MRWATAAGGFRDHWHAVALAGEVRRGPVRKRLFGVPIALWRPDGALAAMVDVCPHRGAPLSGGRVDRGLIVCPYHGYQFDRDGRCHRVPILGDQPLSLRAVTLPVRESDGLVWVSLGKPERDPPALALDGRGWTSLRLTHELPAPFDQVVENFVDSGHTGLVHRGLIRGSRAVARQVRIERRGDSVLVAHQPVAEDVGLLRRLYGSAETSHTDRFTLPATVEVRYDLGRGRAFAALLYCSPTEDQLTTLFAVIAVRLGPLLNPLARLALPRLARRVLVQDAAITGATAENLRRLDWTPGFSPSDEMHRLIAELIAAGRAGAPLPPDVSRTVELWL